MPTSTRPYALRRAVCLPLLGPLLLLLLCPARATIPGGLPAGFQGDEAELAAMSEQRMRELGFSMGARVRTLKWQKRRRPSARDAPPLDWRLGPFKRTAAGSSGPEVRANKAWLASRWGKAEEASSV